MQIYIIYTIIIVITGRWCERSINHENGFTWFHSTMVILQVMWRDWITCLTNTAGKATLLYMVCSRWEQKWIVVIFIIVNADLYVLRFFHDVQTLITKAAKSKSSSSAPMTEEIGGWDQKTEKKKKRFWSR